MEAFWGREEARIAYVQRHRAAAKGVAEGRGGEGDEGDGDADAEGAREERERERAGRHGGAVDETVGADLYDDKAQHRYAELVERYMGLCGLKPKGADD